MSEQQKHMQLTFKSHLVKAIYIYCTQASRHNAHMVCLVQTQHYNMHRYSTAAHICNRPDMVAKHRQNIWDKSRFKFNCFYTVIFKHARTRTPTHTHTHTHTHTQHKQKTIIWQIWWKTLQLQVVIQFQHRQASILTSVKWSGKVWDNTNIYHRQLGKTTFLLDSSRVCVCACVCVHVCMHMHACVCICVCVHAYMCICEWSRCLHRLWR